MKQTTVMLLFNYCYSLCVSYFSFVSKFSHLCVDTYTTFGFLERKNSLDKFVYLDKLFEILFHNMEFKFRMELPVCSMVACPQCRGFESISVNNVFKNKNSK